MLYILCAPRHGRSSKKQRGTMQVISTLIEAHIFRHVGDDIEFLLLKRAPHEKYGGVWQMVTGAIDEGEKAYETALREIKEETGFTPQRFWTAPNVNSFYYPERDYINMIPVFAAQVEAGSEVVISDEHDDYKWVNKEEALKLLAWPGQRQSVKSIYEYFTVEENFLKFVEMKLG